MASSYPDISHKKAHRGAESAKVVLRQRLLPDPKNCPDAESVAQTCWDLHLLAAAKLWEVLMAGRSHRTLERF
jgi:hypothetical protein